MGKHNKLFYLVASGFFLVWALPSASEAQTIASRFSGSIVLQVEQHGEAWYVNPSDQLRYYLGRPADAFQLMQHLGLGISNADLELIPKPKQTWDGRQDIMARVRGKIVLQVEQHGEAWYVNPSNGKRYYLGRPADAFRAMTQFGIGMTDENLWNITPEVGVTVVQAEGLTSALDEFAQLTNQGQVDRDLSGWVLQNEKQQAYTFTDGFQLAAGESVRVYTNQGEVQFGSQQEIWNDQGGVVELFDEHGTFIQTYTYTFTPPSSVISTIPFTTQAPGGQWNTSPFDEACEEAILVMLHAWQTGQPLTATYAQEQILKLADWELTTFGFHQDTSAAYTSRTAMEYYGLDTSVSSDVSILNIKHLIATGHPVIVPVWGRGLNPHYTQGGPYYHMILIVGYDDDVFITMDPGTSYGQHYYYNQQALLEAIHDFVYPEQLTYLGDKRMLVVNP